MERLRRLDRARIYTVCALAGVVIAAVVLAVALSR